MQLLLFYNWFINNKSDKNDKTWNGRAETTSVNNNSTSPPVIDNYQPIINSTISNNAVLVPVIVDTAFVCFGYSYK